LPLIRLKWAMTSKRESGHGTVNRSIQRVEDDAMGVTRVGSLTDREITDAMGFLGAGAPEQ
jgi:hypothetical protein